MWCKNLHNKVCSNQKKNENEVNNEKQRQLDEAVRLLELDQGHNETYTHQLIEDVNVLRNKIQNKTDKKDR